ncbi:MAG: AAC(3) family N-acetyltransferase [Phycisphaerales bacterium]|nr:MAG: AAC(3) family N-acetyltransferase [Phycisphaerales bacterium]
MMLKYYASQILPRKYIRQLRSAAARRARDRRKQVPFGEGDLLFTLREICGVKNGDVLFVHSSIDGLAMDISPRRILQLLLDTVGPEGTILMPSYPKLTSYAFLQSGQVWDVRRTPSYSGLLTEIFRRMEGTRRSLHPTKSVAARGPRRDELIGEHHTDIRPYGAASPYYKFITAGGKAIGIGVSVRYIAFIHAIDDHLGERFPVTTYRGAPLPGKVLDYSGEPMEVATLAHDLRLSYDPVGLLRRHVPREQAHSLTYKSREFFYADAKTVFEIGVRLAQQGITIYDGRLKTARRRLLTIRSPRRRQPVRERVTQ